MLLIIINGERDKRSFKFFSSHRIVFCLSYRTVVRVTNAHYDAIILSLAEVSGRSGRIRLIRD